MSIHISPLDLLLDDENPRFVILGNRKQEDIRRYLLTYEDVCALVGGINDYGGLLPGERIVALKRDDKYVVIEGNRRTCSLQILLDPNLVPEGFQHRIPKASDEIKNNCQTIEVDLVPNREAALALMTRRHIDGVKQWKPLAKKQFSAANYVAGMSVADLSRITGMPERDIKADIIDYKFFLAAYNEYCGNHPDYHGQIIDLKIDPFLRVFKAKFSFNGKETKPAEALKISHTEDFETTSDLPGEVFTTIVQTVFEEAVVSERINTRNTLADVTGVTEVLKSVAETGTDERSQPNTSQGDSSAHGNSDTSKGSSEGGASGPGGSTPSGAASGGPAPGGPAPRTFFESLNWDKLSPDNPEHAGLLTAVNELYHLSRNSFGRKRAYEVFPVATGMILRTAYEQTLRLCITKADLWGPFMATVSPKGSFPTLSGMEKFIDNPTYKVTILPSEDLRAALSMILRYSHREFLNANIHSPGNIRVSPESLVAIAQGGMFTLIQESINLF